MKKKIISILLTLCMVVGLIPFTGLAGDNFTVTVNAGAGGKVSADGGTTWSSSVTVTVPDGEKIGDRVTYRADEGYELESATSRANITAVSAGLHFTAIIDDKGQAYTAGDSGNGKRALGNPLTLASSSSSAWFFAKPTNGIDGSNIKAIATGKYHTVVLDGNGDVYTTGSNTKGQLGRDVSDALKEKYPNLTSIPCENCFYKVNVGDGTVKIKAIAASKEGGYCGHTVLIDENGKVWTAGSNYYMQLGRTVTASTKIDAEFKQVDGDVNNTTIVAAAGGENHTVLLDHEGNVWTAGDSFYGANGQNGARCRVFTKCNIDGNPKIVAIATGSSFSILLDENGNVYATGQNSSGQLGLGDYTERKVFTKVTLPEGVKIASIAAGSYYTVLIDEDGKVYTAGKNDYGQLGQPLENAKINIFTPVTINGIGEHKIVSAAAGEDHTVLLDDVGRIWTAGNTYSNEGICRLLKPYKESDPNFALAMSSPVLQTAIDDLAEFTVTGNNTIDITFKEKEKINITYDLNGGDWISGYTPPTFYYKGDSFSAPDGEKLVKNGYLAQSWTISKTADENTLLYTISWEAKSDYTVAFDSNGGSNVDSKTNVKWTDKVLEGVSDPNRDGYVFTGWKCGDVTVTADTTYADLAVNDTVESVTITAQWSEKGNYSVEFDTDGGTAIGNKTNVKWTDKVLDGITAPTKNGYDFAGFKHGDATVTADTTYADLAADDTVESITITAQWTEKSDFTVVFDTVGGTSIGNKTNVKWTDKVLDGVTAPTKDGYAFAGFKCGEVTVTADTTYADLAVNDTAKSITLTAQWTEKDNYIVMFYTDGGTTISDKTNVKWTDKVLDGVSAPTKTGYEFAGWMCGDDTVTADTTFADLAADDTTVSILLTAQWNEKSNYTVAFDTVDGTAIGNKTNVKWTDKVLDGITAPTKNGYAFAGFKCGEVTVNADTTYADLAVNDTVESITLTAQWTEKDNYTVIFYSDGGTTINDKHNVKWTDKVLDGVTAPTKNGYDFAGWKYIDVAVTADTTFADLAINDTVISVTILAQWTEKSDFTVTFDTVGGTTISDKTNVKWTDKVLDGVSAPTKDGYIFDGFKCGDVTVTADTTYADLAVNDTEESVTLTAQFTDIAAPTGEIKIVENSWKAFFNDVTFGLFFKDTQTVTITATDNSGEEVTIEYLLSNRALTEQELEEMTFTSYTEPFGINPDNEYVVYAKLTDTSGNVAYLNTDGIVLDATVPEISGIENGKTYCAAQTVTVSDKYISTVTVNGEAVTLDENNQFTLNPAEDVQTIIVTDKAGNETVFTVTVNDGHTYEWQSENGQYWQKCKFCDDETAKNDIPTVTINSSDKVCRTQDLKFDFTLPDGVTDAVYGYEFNGLGDGALTPIFENDLYSGIIKATAYAEGENSFKLTVTANTSDGFTFTAEKIIEIQNEHSGGKATCKDKAVCEVCGESYGEVDANNHTDLKHTDAKAATKPAEGNIEYWYCEDCGKYYKDSAATIEITKADTAIAKLENKDSDNNSNNNSNTKSDKSPQTGDNSDMSLLWLALLLVSFFTVAAATVADKNKKHREN